MSGGADPARSGGRVVAAAWWPTARAASWRPALAAGALAIVVIGHRRLADPSADAGSFALQAQLVALVTAAAVASLLTDPAARLLDASPTTLGRRTMLRLSLCLLAWVVTWTVALALIATAPGEAPNVDLTRQALVLLAVAVGAAAWRGPMAGAAGVAVLAAASIVLPDRWSILGDGSAAAWRLHLIALAGLTVLGHASRDPARLHRRWRQRRAPATRGDAPPAVRVRTRGERQLSPVGTDRPPPPMPEAG